MRTNANWARIVMVFFTVAMFYASVCSASCANGVCPDKVQQTSSHDCEQMPAHHAGQSGHKAPESPDCSRHQHPNMLFTQSGEIAKVQPNVVDSISETTVAISNQDVTTSLIHAEASDLAPPPASNVPLYQQISVLRI